MMGRPEIGLEWLEHHVRALKIATEDIPNFQVCTHFESFWHVKRETADHQKLTLKQHWFLKMERTQLRFSQCPENWCKDQHIRWRILLTHDGSMVLLYMVCHGSHQYTPFMLAYIPYMDPMGYATCISCNGDWIRSSDLSTLGYLIKEDRDHSCLDGVKRWGKVWNWGNLQKSPTSHGVYQWMFTSQLQLNRYESKPFVQVSCWWTSIYPSILGSLGYQGSDTYPNMDI